MTLEERAPSAGTSRFGYVAAGCGGLLLVLALTLCGLAAMIRQYRELTVPLSLVLGAGAVALGVIAYFALRRRGAE